MDRWVKSVEEEKSDKKSKKEKKKKTDETSTLLNSKGWQKHWVNHAPFTVYILAFTLIVFGAVIMTATTVVTGGAKEVQEYFPPIQTSLKNKAYGSHHAGMGFANYVVGNAVSNFWNTEMGKKGPPGAKAQKMTDPFASFLLKPKKGKKAQVKDDDDGESPEQHADEAQPVDEAHHRIGRSKATATAIKHAQMVARSHVHRGRHGRSHARATSDSEQAQVVMANRQPPGPRAIRSSKQ